MPDTQNYDGERIGLLQAQADCLAEHDEELNLRFVAHVGDVVHESGNMQAWEDAREAMAALDDHVPYGHESTGV